MMKFLRALFTCAPAGMSLGRARTCDAARKQTSSAPTSPRLVEYLKKRGFTPISAAPLSLEALESVDEVAAKLPLIQPAKAGFKIPYFDIEGRRNGFYRFRYFETGWDRLTNGKSFRYMQEPNSGVHAYFSPLVNWRKLAHDTEQPLGITEGEMKASLATLHGIPFIALGGVWSFRAKKQGCALLPELSEKNFRWKDRVVYICYDSDVEDNEQVAAAQNALARELTNLGAIVKLCYPSQLGDGKTGLDDFIVARGFKAFQKQVLDQADDWQGSKALHEMNEEVIFIESPTTGIIVRRKDSAVMRYLDFENAIYSDRSYTITEGRTLKRKSTAKEWMHWPHRAKAARIVYEPGAPRITDANEWNVWTGWGFEPKKGNVKPFLELFNHLAAGLSEAEKKWLLQWFAYPLQHPGTKLHTAVVLWGYKQGTGKSVLGYAIMKIYGENAIEIGEKDLHGEFNHWAVRRQFVMGDEIAGGDKRVSADRMKSTITRPSVTINQKHTPQYTIRDCVNYYFTSNHPDSFSIEDNDRRYFVHEVTVTPFPQSFYDEYGGWLEGEGPAALFEYLLKVDTSDFNPNGHAPMTKSKEAMIEMGRSALESFIVALPERTEVSRRKLWKAKEIALLFNADPKDAAALEKAVGRVMGRYYKQWGLRGNNKRAMPVKEVNARLWIVSHDQAEIARFNAMSEAAIAEHYKAELAAQQKAIQPKL